MKLNLKCGKEPRAGYLNIDNFQHDKIPPDIYRQGDISSLDWLAEDNSVDEIIAMDCLSFILTSIVKQAVANWAQKLIAGGTLKILTPDCHAIAKSFSQGQFNLQEYSQMLFGTQENNDNRLSVIDSITLLNILKENGLTIVLKRYEGISLYVEAIK
jgi:predicted SAM-dependent methyltransferase